jgi:glycerol kinase
MAAELILGIDQGSSGSRAAVLGADGELRGYGYRPLARILPRPGWVEQSPAAVTASVSEAIALAMQAAGCAARDIVACGITSQRDTVFAWDATRGEALGNAITWQDLRTQPLVAASERWPLAHERRLRLGQFPGPYCSAMHIAWRMRHDEPFRRAAEEGRLRLSLSAGWIVQSLGSLAANTLDFSLLQGMTVFDFRTRSYWEEWLEYLDIPRAALPGPAPTLHPFGTLRLRDARGGAAEVPVLAMIADQQAALFGYDCRSPGEAACTHGTNSFVNVVAGHTPPAPGIAKTYLAWELEGAPTYSLEADTTVTGAAIRWMQEQMGFFRQPRELGPLAMSVPDAAGVAFVPAFTGLGVPSEDRSARATLLGMTLDTTPAHIARAFLEAIGCQLREILDTFGEQAGIAISQLAVGGGISASDEACQIQADLLGLPLTRAANAETSVRAAALLAGLAGGLWADLAALPPLPGPATRFEPRMPEEQRAAIFARWQRAVERARNWEAG